MRELKNLLEKMELSLRRHRLISSGDAILIGVSGGADSTALTLLLTKIQKKYRLRLAVAYLNHGLFPKQAAQHERFVKKLCGNLGLEFYSKKANVKKMARVGKRSLEEAGRDARYAFFQEIAAKHHWNKIATAHTLDDQAETILMRILRGTGLRGLTGIPSKRDTESGIPVIRPLLGISKKEIVLFLKKAKTPYCQDASNESLDFTRNKLRKNFIPSLEKAFNPKLKESLASLGQLGDGYRRYLDTEVARSFQKALLSSPASSTKLRVLTLTGLPEATLSEVLLCAANRRRGRNSGLGFNHVASIIDILRSDENALEISLPGGLRVRKGQGTLEFIDTASK